MRLHDTSPRVADRAGGDKHRKGSGNICHPSLLLYFLAMKSCLQSLGPVSVAVRAQRDMAPPNTTIWINRFRCRLLTPPMILAEITMKSDTDLDWILGQLRGAAEFRPHRTDSRL